MKLILLLFSFIIFIYPQEKKNGHLFDKYIPDIVKTDKTNLNQIYENIEVNSSLHPSLLYYYFEHLDLRFNQNITKADSNLSLKLSILRNDFRKKRDDFALIQEQLIEQHNFVRIKENAMVSCFDELFIDYDETKTKVKEDNINKNKQDYFIVVYLRERYEDYNPELDYSKILQEETQDRLNYFRNKRLNFENMNRDEKISFIDEMNKYWYFFNKEEVYFDHISEFQQSDLA